MYLDAHYAKVRRGGRVQDVAILANDIYLRGIGTRTRRLSHLYLSDAEGLVGLYSPLLLR